jgi:membrane-associated HD superfamily phosphohydrolase
MGGTLVPINDYLQGIENYTSGQQQDVTTAAGNLSELQTGAGNLPSMLKKALNEKLNYNKDIINQQSDVMQQYFAAPSAARAKYQDVWNPFEREKLVAQDRTMALKPYDTLSGVLQQRMGDVADITEAGVQGWQGMVNAAATQLEAAQTRLGSALQAYQIAGGQQSAADELALSIAKFNEANKQFEATMNYNVGKDTQEQSNWEKEFGLSQYKATHTGDGGDVTNPDDVEAIARFIFDNNLSPDQIPNYTTAKNTNAVLGIVNRLRNEKFEKDKADADKLNSTQTPNWLKDKVFNKESGYPSTIKSWFSNVFGGNDSSSSMQNYLNDTSWFDK